MDPQFVLSTGYGQRTLALAKRFTRKSGIISHSDNLKSICGVRYGLNDLFKQRYKMRENV